MGVPNRYCYGCLCRYCNRVHCPKPFKYRFREPVLMCIRCMQQDCGATIECDYFEHKFLKKYYIIKRKFKRADLEDKINRILELLEKTSP